MAPYLEKKIEPKRVNYSSTSYYEGNNGTRENTGDMQLLHRCPRSYSGDYYQNDTNAGEAATAAATTAAAAAAAAAGRIVRASSVTGTNLRINTEQPKATSTGPTVTTIRQSNILSIPRNRLTPHHHQRPQLQTNHKTQQKVSQPQQQQQQQQRTQTLQNQQQHLRVAGFLSGALEPLRRSNELVGTISTLGSTQELCDNSNDSGLGFEERQQQLNKVTAWSGPLAGEEDSKRRKMDIKLESEDANFAFREMSPTPTDTKMPGNSRTDIGAAGRLTAAAAAATNSSVGVNGSVGRVAGNVAIGGQGRPRSGLGNVAKRLSASTHQGPVTLVSQLSHMSRNGKVLLQIVCQPETQHRARYQTEGSRGAVKDRSGNGFPIVRLINYDKPTTLQVFIGTDLGRVAPHMFYQACRVSGKNSTPCVERKIDGTIVIEVDMDPLKDMLVTCDCVGILKERNVDVEHRFPNEASAIQGRSKKKSTRCRMIFRTTIVNDDGTTETLQICSQPIVCTQPPGIPEISKKSLTSCPCTGGLELFILGKNFLKDTRVLFRVDSDDINSSMEPIWECTVVPDKEFLQQTHLVCVVPPYRRQDLALGETVSIKLSIMSSGKISEPHCFLYTASSAPPTPSVGKLENNTSSLIAPNSDAILASKLPVKPLAGPANVTSPTLLPTSTGPASFLGTIQSAAGVAAVSAVSTDVLKSDPSPPPVTAPTSVTPVMLWSSQAAGGQAPDVMMPPPANMMGSALMNRRSSSTLQLILPDNLKTEVLDENSQNSLMGENNLSGMSNGAPAPASSTLEQLVNENSRDASQGGLIRNTVTANSSPVQEMMGVVDLMRSQHSMNLVPQQSAFAGLQESSQVKVLSPRHINKENSPIMTNDANLTNSMQSTGVVDLRMKHHQSEFNGIGNGNLGSFAVTPADQPLPTQTGHSVEKYLNQIESTPKKTEVQDANFVRASIIASNQQQTNLLTPTSATGPLDNLVNSAIESHQIVSPLRPANSSPNSMINQVVSETITSPQQMTTSSPPIPVKNMLLEALMPTASISPLSVESNVSTVSNVSVVQEPMQDSLSINTTLMSSMQDATAVTAVGAAANVNSNVTSHNNLQVTSEVIPSVATAIVLAQDPVSIQHQVQQVEQVVAHAQQQVEQVVAQAQQQAVQAVQQAQQQVVHQVVQHAQVVQQAVQQVQAIAPSAPALQQAVQQATQEVVQQAVQQATQEVVQQVQAVQQAVQQAQAARTVQQAVQQDIGSMLGQPVGFIAEASSALASDAAAEPSQQRLANEAEMAINNVITNATQDIINNQIPITTTTAHAIIATKNILNNVVTQSAQLMNNAMENILPKSPSTPQTIVEQVTSKSPPIGAIQMQTSNVVTQQVSMQQQPLQAQTQQVVPQQVQQSNTVVSRRSDGNTNGMLSQELMTDHELLNYINSGCFDPQSEFIM